MASDWATVGEVTVGPDDLRVVVGSFSLQEGDDTLWVDVQQTNPGGPWPWSYGILSFETAFGSELGSVKAYTTTGGEVFRLGVGLEPRSRVGSIVYQPRSFNLAWVKNGYPLTLAFSACSGTSVQQSGSGSLAFAVDDAVWRYAAESGLLRVSL